MRWLMNLLVALLLAIVAGILPSQPTRHAPNPTPTLDRLAPPPTVASPTQADVGAQVYWLNCQPCHGDRGQGLTDEWREQYPPEDRNCWDSGCHGDRPYDDGFTLPQTVPAVIGPGTLKRFNTAADVYDFTRSAMPFTAPGSLTPTEYMQLTVFLLERNGVVRAGTSLDPSSAATVFVHGVPPTSAPGVVAQPAADDAASAALVGVALLLIGAAGFALFRRRPSR